MFQEFIGRFFGVSQRIIKNNSVRNTVTYTKSCKSGLLTICLGAALFFTIFMSYGAQADMLAATGARSENSSAFQSNLEISPIAQGEQIVIGSSADSSKIEEAAAADGVFHQANGDLFPISSGKQVNQTSFVLIGAVLVALTMVVGLAIGRKET